MSGFTYVNTATTTTWDATNGMLLRITIEDGMYLVRDFTGLRYGAAAALADAVDEWAADVESILAIPDAELGPPLPAEVAAYRKALSR